MKEAKIAVFGIGGVGSYVVEALVRAGIGKIVLIDGDDVSISNINRQIIALTDTIGRPKVEVAKERIQKINPNIKVEVYKEFFMPESKRNNRKRFRLYNRCSRYSHSKNRNNNKSKRTRYTSNLLYGNRKQARPRQIRNRRHI